MITITQHITCTWFGGGGGCIARYIDTTHYMYLVDFPSGCECVPRRDLWSDRHAHHHHTLLVSGHTDSSAVGYNI